MKFLFIKTYVVQNPSLGVLNRIYSAKYKFTFVKKGVPSYHVLYVHEYFWRKNKKRTGHGKFSRCHMHQSPHGACRVSRIGDRWSGLFCLDPFPRHSCWEIRALIGRVRQTDALAAANRRHRQNLALPALPDRSTCFVTTPPALIGSCSLGGVLDEAAQPTR